MPRRARKDIKGYWYHVICRGQRKNPIFFSRKDMLHYLKLLRRALKRFDIYLGGYCLMRNHIHLLLFRGTDSLYRMMHYLNTNYALYFNKKYNTVGHVYQGRYKSMIILHERYLFNVLNYIHFNPVKAGLVKDPSEYQFSSDNFYRGEKSNISMIRIPGFEGKNGEREYKKFIESREDGKLIEYQDCIGTEEEYKQFEKRQRDITPVIDRREKRNVEKAVKTLLKGRLFLLKGLCSRSKNHKLSNLRKELIVT